MKLNHPGNKQIVGIITPKHPKKLGYLHIQWYIYIYNMYVYIYIRMHIVWKKWHHQHKTYRLLIYVGLSSLMRWSSQGPASWLPPISTWSSMLRKMWRIQNCFPECFLVDLFIRIFCLMPSSFFYNPPRRSKSMRRFSPTKNGIREDETCCESIGFPLVFL